MTNHTPTPFNSLAWVKHEIDHTLDTARQSIQQYAGNPDETQHLVIAASNLRDAQGALEVANLEGAAQLAGETIEVITALGKGDLTDTDAVCNQLLRSLIQLPDYLDYVQSGKTDAPMVLLPVINDLRSLRKAPLVADEINDLPGAFDDERVLLDQGHSGEDLLKLADITRALFEVGLVGWYRERDVPASLGKMAVVVHRLRMASHHLGSRRLWWIAGAVIEALKGEVLETSAALKPLMGKIDREIKRLFKEGEEQFAATVAPELTQNLLQYIAAARTGVPFVDEVRDTYFGRELPDNVALQASRESLSGQNLQLNRSVSESLRSSIDKLKLQLDEYQQSGYQAPNALDQFSPGLKKLADELGVVGLEARQSQAMGILQRLETAGADGSHPSEPEMQYFAHTLLDIEDAVTTLGAGTDKRAVDRADEPSADRKFTEVRGVVIQEVLREIERCKDNIQHYAADLEEQQPLRETLGQFTQIAGSMHLLSLDAASDLVNNIRAAVELILNGDIQLDIDSLDNLAESIAAVEVYLEVLDTSNMSQESYIEIGQAALLKMRQEHNIPEPSQYNSYGDLPEFVDETPTAAFDVDEGTLDTLNDALQAPEFDEGLLEGAIGLDPDEVAEGEELSEIFGADVSLNDEQLLEQSGLQAAFSDDELQPAEPEATPSFSDIAQQIEVAELEMQRELLSEDTSESQQSALADLEAQMSQQLMSPPDLLNDDVGMDVDTAALSAAEAGEELSLSDLSDQQVIADAVSLDDVGLPAAVDDAAMQDDAAAIAGLADHLDELEIPAEGDTFTGTLGSEIFPDIQFGQDDEALESAELDIPHSLADAGEVQAVPSAEAPMTDPSFTGTNLDYSAEQQSLLDGDVYIDMDTDPGANEEPLDYVSMTQAEVEGWDPESLDDLPEADEADEADSDGGVTFAEGLALGAAASVAGSVAGEQLFDPNEALQPSNAAVDDTLGMFGGYQAQALYGLKMLSAQPDEEVYSIFLEELNEETAHLRVSFGRFQEDPQDQDALTTTRRSFHTIKGSARLIGAQVIGEYAWVHERLLNQVLDKQLAPTAPLLACIEQGIELLPQLQKQLERRELASEAIHRQVDRAEQISRGEEPAVASPTEPLPEPDEPALTANRLTGQDDELPELDLDAIEAADLNDAAEDDAVTEPTIASIDRELIGVFTADSRRHLATLKAAVASSAANPEQLFPESGMIAVHTLNGAARTARVEEIFKPAAAAERYLSSIREAGQAPDEDGHEQLNELVSHVHSVLDSLEREEDCIEGDDIAQQFDQLSDAFAAQQMIAAAKIGDNFEPEPLDESLTNLAFEMPDEDSTDFTLTSLDVEALDFDDPSETAALPDEQRDALAEQAVESESTDDDHAALDSAIVAFEHEKTAQLIPDLPTLGTTTLSADADEMALQMSELAEIFSEECEQILGNCDAAMARWQDNPLDGDAVGEIKRELHTLKGSARMAGIESVGHTAHSMETLLQHMDDQGIPAGRDHFTVLNAAFDHIGESVTALRNHDELPANGDLLALLEKVQQGESLAQDDLRALVAGTEPSQEPSQEPATVEPATVEPVPATVVPEPLDNQPLRVLEGELALPVNDAVRAESHESPLQEAIRIPADLLDRMVDNIGEVNVCHARVEQQVGSVKFNLQELDQTIRRVTEQLRRLEMEAEAQILHRYGDQELNPDDSSARAQFDPLELDRYSTLQQLSRSLAETTNDLTSIHQLLNDEVREMEGALLAQGKVSNELQEGLMRTRMSKFQLMVPRLRRVVRRTALELGKDVNLQIAGDDNEMDRKMLESIVVPLEHLLRNAVFHGIESREERTAAGKAESGEVNVSISREGPEVIIEVTDDGRGLNEQKIRQRAIEQGLVSGNDQLTRGEIQNLILKPGFSTAETVSEDAGRGVGMDVVNTQLKQLNGVLDIQSQPGKGSTFRIALPFTLAINQALLLEAGDGVYAIPMNTIDGVMQANGKSLMEKLESGEAVIHYAGKDYAVTQLVAAMNRTRPLPMKTDATYPVIFAHSGEQRYGFIAGRILGNREVVVKPMGSLLQGVDGISGATILGDGRIVVILDMAGLIRLTQKDVPLQELPLTDMTQMERKVVLVVDDSITIRKVTSKMLERHNFTVVTAKDGMDAVGKLGEQAPDVILLDIEMPRMDGFEFASHVRNSSEYRNTPIIMISSRTGTKHRERAAQIGVNHFLGKPYQDEELLAEIDRQLQENS